MMMRIFNLALYLCAVGILVVSVSARASDDHIAIKGYDTVAYFTESQARKGNPQYRFEWDGSVYQFASQHHLDLFKADPEKYTPVYKGFCTAALSRGLKVVADPENWKVHEGRLHIFGKPIGPGLMEKDPDGMKAKADANFPRIAELPEPTPQQPAQ